MAYLAHVVVRMAASSSDVERYLGGRQCQRGEGTVLPAQEEDVVWDGSAVSTR